MCLQGKEISNASFRFCEVDGVESVLYNHNEPVQCFYCLPQLIELSNSLDSRAN